VRHPTEGKISLPRLSPTVPSCLGAIKGTLGAWRSHPKHSLSNLILPHSVSAHLIDRVSDLSFVLVVNYLCFILSSSLGLCACVCCGFVCCSPTLLRAFFVINLVRREAPTCGDSSQTGKDIRKNTVVFKLIIGSLERG
jgi:hypothetical protein